MPSRWLAGSQISVEEFCSECLSVLGQYDFILAFRLTEKSRGCKHHEQSLSLWMTSRDGSQCQVSRSDWSSCSATCGTGGKRKRTRDLIKARKALQDASPRMA